jgi:lipoate-protein ligase A
LHQGDLTYAVITSGLAGNRQIVYQHLCEFLIRGWRSLSIDLRYGQAGRGYIHNPDCFGTATVADLVDTTGAKLVGCAQLRRSSAILQHGSMRLAPDPDLFGQVFGAAAVDDLPTGLLSQLGGTSLTAAQVCVTEALTIAAADWFQVKLVIKPLSEAEWHAIAGDRLQVSGDRV